MLNPHQLADSLRFPIDLAFVLDLGYSTTTAELSEDITIRTLDALGTFMYRPPEVTVSNARPVPISGQKSDIWAAGVSIYYALARINIVPHRNTTVPPKAYTEVRSIPVWKALRKKGISEKVMSFLRKA